MRRTIQITLPAALAAFRVRDDRLLAYIIEPKDIHGAYFKAALAPNTLIQICSNNTHFILLPSDLQIWKMPSSGSIRLMVSKDPPADSSPAVLPGNGRCDTAPDTAC